MAKGKYCSWRVSTRGAHLINQCCVLCTGNDCMSTYKPSGSAAKRPSIGHCGLRASLVTDNKKATRVKQQ